MRLPWLKLGINGLIITCKSHTGRPQPTSQPANQPAKKAISYTPFNRPASGETNLKRTHRIEIRSPKENKEKNMKGRRCIATLSRFVCDFALSPRPFRNDGNGSDAVVGFNFNASSLHPLTHIGCRAWVCGKSIPIFQSSERPGCIHPGAGGRRVKS